MESLSALKHKFETWGEGSLSHDFQLRVIDAIKPALSMSIVVALAFYLDFKQPYWAAFAVLMMSFSTTGQAFRRALVGIPGTLIGGTVALTIFSIFPQQPIFLFPVLIIYCGICMYFLQACKVNGYFFFTISFVCLVVITTAIPESDKVFVYALARLEETCLGMTVYAAVTLLLWRRSAWPILQEKVGVMTSLHAELFKAQMRRVQTKSKKEVFALQRKAFRALDKTEELVGFAITDSYEVWENRDDWHSFITHSRELVRAQLRWGWVVPELRKDYMQASLPDLGSKVGQMETRLIAMKQGLHAEHLRNFPKPISLKRNEAAFEKLPHYLQAQVLVVQDAFNVMGNLVHTIMHYHCFFHDNSLERPKPFVLKSVWEFPLNYEYVVYAFQSAVLFSMTVIVWFFLYPPGLDNAQFIMLGGAFSLISVFVKTHAPLRDGIYYVSAAIIAIVVYVLTLPHMTTYYELGTLIFCVTFVVYFTCIKANQALFKLAMMLAWLSLPKFSNVQIYDFTMILNGGMAMAVAGILVSLGLYITSYPVPERRFMQARRRFFSSAIYLLDIMPRAVSGEITFLERVRLKACLQNFVCIPQAMLGIAELMDEKRIGISRKRIGGVIFSFELLGEALFSLYVTHKRERNVPIPSELSAMLNDWRHAKIATFELLENKIISPNFDSDRLQKSVRRRLQGLEHAIERSNKQADMDGRAVSQQENEILYLLLGRNRGLSNAMIEYMVASKAIDWNKWVQPRF